jgi:hypothetical protein
MPRQSRYCLTLAARVTVELVDRRPVPRGAPGHGYFPKPATPLAGEEESQGAGPRMSIASYVVFDSGPSSRERVALTSGDECPARWIRTTVGPLLIRSHQWRDARRRQSMTPVRRRIRVSAPTPSQLMERLLAPKRLRFIALGHRGDQDAAPRSEEILAKRFAR